MKQNNPTELPQENNPTKLQTPHGTPNARSRGSLQEPSHWVGQRLGMCATIGAGVGLGMLRDGADSLK